MKKLLVWIIAVLLIIGILNFVPFKGDSITGHIIGASEEAEVDPAVEEQLEEEGKAIVIVKLKDKPVERALPISGLAVKETKELNEQALEVKKEMIKETQKEVLDKLNLKEEEGLGPEREISGVLKPKELPDLKLEHQYETINSISGEISKQGLEKLKKDKNVEYIEIVRSFSAFLDGSIPLINADDTWKLMYNSTNLTGAGETVCIIDTGVDYTHPALGNCTIEEFLAGNCSKVIGGYDIINNDNNPKDDHSHGTHCAGIVASTDETYRGVAPGAKIVAMKVLDMYGYGSTQTIVAGIDWCTNKSSEYNISVISMSLGTNSYHSPTYCDDYSQSMTDAVNSAVGAGITVFVASGNNYQTNGISNPACIENATPVGSTDKNDNYVSYSNSAPILNIVAPGGISSNKIQSCILGGAFSGKYGTSMATPHAAGAAAILQQFKQLKENKSFTPQEIEDLLNLTGKQIYYPITSKNYSRIDVFASIVSQDSAAPEINIIYPDNNASLNGSATINITSNELLSSALLEFNGINETMLGNNCDWHIIKYENGTHSYRAWGRDLVGNWGVSEIRNISIKNYAPIILSFYPNTTQINIAEPNNQTFNITAIDPENADLNISWYLNENLQSSGINQTEWSLIGNYSFAGNYNITVIVIDNYNNNSNKWGLLINNTNRAPSLISVIPNQSWGMDINKTINLSLYFNDFDNDDMNFSSTLVQNITVHIDNDTSIAIFEPDFSFGGVRHVVFTAFDIHGENISSNNVTLNILGDHSPEVKGIAVICSDELNRTNGNLEGSFMYYDADDNNQTMNQTKWYKNSVEQPSLENLTEVSSAYTLKNQEWTFSARVRDNSTWSDWSSATITIQNDIPQTPTLLSPANNGYYTSIDIEYSSTDIDNDTIYYYVYINDSLNSTSSSSIPDWEGSDGYYSLEVSAYDNGSFSPNSSVIYFTKDNTAPTIISMNSSENMVSVITDEKATCRYKNSDVSYDNMEDMDNTGNLNHSHIMVSSGIYYIRCIDLAGNKMNHSDSIYVTIPITQDDDDNEGGATTPPAVTLVANKRDTHTFSVLPKGTTTKTISKSELAFTGYVIEINSALALVTITTEAVQSLPSTISPPLGNIHQYITINAPKIPAEAVDSVEIQFKVEQDWLKGLDIDSVKLKRFTTKWEELETKRIAYKNGDYYYSAKSPGFSYFAITAKPEIEYEAFEAETPEEPVVEEPAHEIIEEEIAPPKGAVELLVKEPDKESLFSKIKKIIPYIGIAIAVVVGIIIIGLVSTKIKRHKKTKTTKKYPKRCPNCGSANLKKGRSNVYCANCGTVIKWS